MKIEIWSDYACPYCYIGKRNLEKALENFPDRKDIDISFKSFELDPSASHETTTNTKERISKKYRMSMEKSQQMIDSITDYAKSVGLDFKYDTVRSSNTFDAHRIEKYADDVRYDEYEASRLGIQAVPFFLINEKYSISGAQPSEAFEKTIEKVLQEEKALESVEDDNSGGMVCNSNGCSIPNKK